MEQLASLPPEWGWGCSPSGRGAPQTQEGLPVLGADRTSTWMKNADATQES